MATITSAGVGSGLDIESIISGLMEVEKQPLKRLDSKEKIVNAQISAYGSLKSKTASFQTAMSNLDSPSSFQLYQATSADKKVFTTTATSSAEAGSYAIEVSALADRHKLVAAGYTDADTAIGEGTLAISVGSDSFNVDIDASNHSVSGIRDAINNAADNSGVTASLVTDDSGAHLVLTADETGTANALSVTVSDSDADNTDTSGLSALAYTADGTQNLGQITAATDAVVKIDGANGFTVTSSSNTISTALQGVTINAKAIGSSTLTVSRDDNKIAANVQSFVNAYNGLHSEINSQRKGQLEADSTLLTMENQQSDVLNSGSAISGSDFTYLVDVGVSIDKHGVMSVDSSKLKTAMDSDFNSFVNLFSAPDEGFASRMGTLADNWLSSGDDGLIDARKEGLNNQLDRIDNDKESLNRRLDITEKRLRAQFSALDSLVGSLKSQGDFLTQQLSSNNGK